MMLIKIVEHYGWEHLGQKIKIRCFNFDPSIKSSLSFLRKTPWARAKVEDQYLRYIRTSSRLATPAKEESPKVIFDPTSQQ